MLKNLLLMRHAKSDWGNLALDDFERPLNKRGRKAAAKMAQWLSLNAPPIEAIVSSPAKRARQTTEIIA